MNPTQLALVALLGGVFVGLGRAEDVDAYLNGVARSTVTGIDDDEKPQLRFDDGGAPRGAPQDERFWVASSAGQGERTIRWEPDEGDWTLVMMREDAGAPVRARVEIGAELPVLGTIAITMAVIGGVLVILAIILLWAALHRRRTS